MNKYRFGKSNWRKLSEGIEKEWILTNGIGGFANGTIVGDNSRIFSGYLIASLKPPVDRKNILAKTQERVIVNGKEIDLACQQYVGYEKEGHKYLESFEIDIVPTFRYQVDDISIKKTISMEYGKNTVVVCYEVENGIDEIEFKVTPLFACRDFGSTNEKADLKFDVKLDKNTLSLKKHSEAELDVKFYSSCGNYYDRSKIPTSMATPNYLIEENQFYAIDNRNGFLGLDNHFTPYDIVVTLNPREIKKFFVKCTIEEVDDKDGFSILEAYKNRINGLIDKQNCKDDFANRLAQAADNFIVKRESTGLKTILAGFPWFADWGRDTMIALQGLTLCTGRFEDNKEILESFSLYVKNGLIPNVFPNDSKDAPGYNTVDASLWYFYSVDKFLNYTGKDEDYEFIREKIYPKLKEIVEAYKNGTDFSIKMDVDGLICAGSNLDQVTWMDVRVGDWVVTPRHGKPVEINALWYNALKVMEKLSKHFEEETMSVKYLELSEKVKKSFNEKFWNEEDKCLYDVVDENDSKIRPNQIWAVSLPYTMLDREKEKNIVETVYKYLYTSYGLRSLAYTDEEYKPQYIGKLINRDSAYHMGTSWAFPIGGFITAYCKVYDHSPKAIEKANEMCKLFDDHMHDGCINGIAEIFDGSFTCTSRGCYSQAWSVGEVLRAYMEDVLPFLNSNN
ncbi:amylo-alpha-1,6-glucosidase [Clostridium sp. C8-1-8]|uniref:amylo-alpha-1,6-glucosidase n=1 Tax=Clostridium sp. C8-1-8 TaxID=2698831 RepID=UPI001370305C|nr:amylo-alpha-1,6-glucosidase [Clostridium sp. C8-1-8]